MQKNSAIAFLSISEKGSRAPVPYVMVLERNIDSNMMGLPEQIKKRS